MINLSNSIVAYHSLDLNSDRASLTGLQQKPFHVEGIFLVGREEVIINRYVTRKTTGHAQPHSCRPAGHTAADANIFFPNFLPLSHLSCFEEVQFRQERKNPTFYDSRFLKDWKKKPFF